jgi:hypothetical protein
MKTTAAKIDILNSLITAELITADEALEILEFGYIVPEEIRNSPLFKVMNEKKEE